MHLNVVLYSAIVTSLAPNCLATSIRPQEVSRQKTPPFLQRIFHQEPIADFNPRGPESTPAPSSSIEQSSGANIMPVLPENPSSQPVSDGSSIMISDVLGKTRSINIFAGYTRDIDTVSSRLDNQSLNSTILCPLNSVLTALPRKPWEDPKDYDSLGSNAYVGEQGDDRAYRNFRRFVESHVVTDSPWGKGQKVKTMGGVEVWWEERAGKKYIMPGGIEVDNVAEKVGNGEVWILKGIVNYAQ